MNKWIASDIPRVPKAFGIAKGLASEYNEKNIPYIETPCGLAAGSLQYVLVAGSLLTISFSACAKSIRCSHDEIKDFQPSPVIAR